jgi:hypothetical protein
MPPLDRTAGAWRTPGANIDREPKEALDLVIAANVPAEDHPALRDRGRRR